jgi:lipopolysaccharide transport system ATP-binding protein
MADPAVFHVTHWKSGSQWVRGILEAAVPGRIVRLQPDMTHVTKAPIVPGGVYTPVYLGRPPFEQAVGGVDRRTFFVMRDLRDTLVSWYFSLKLSHSPNEFVDQFRARLASLPPDEGLRFLIENRLDGMGWIQQTWLESDALIVRYEDLLADEHGVFKRIFEYCELDVPDERRREIVDRQSFEHRAGRRRGEEDPANHWRKGIAGDWRNHFSPEVKAAFKERLGGALIAAGYEKGQDW